MKKPTEYAELLLSLGKEWKWLLGYASKYRLQIVLYIVMGLISTGMGLGSSIASKYLIDAVISHNNDTIFRSAAPSKPRILAGAPDIFSAISLSVNKPVL